MSEQLLAAQAQLARKDEQLKEEREKRKQIEADVEELNTKLENNAGVMSISPSCFLSDLCSCVRNAFL